MKLALEALEVWRDYVPHRWDVDDIKAVTALREALAHPAPVQKPVAWMHEWEDGEMIPKLHPRDNRKMDKPKSVRPLVYADTETL
jgi:hypothetical protein